MGSLAGSEAGNFIGRKIGGKGKKGRMASKITGGVLSSIGKVAGGIGGALLPFATGGKVNAPRNKPVPAILHGQEFVLPVGVEPTKAQVQAVKKIKLDAKKANK